MKIAITIAVVLLGYALHVLGIPYLVNAVTSAGISQLNGGNTEAAIAQSISSASLWFNLVLTLVVAAVLYLTWKK
jgi:hypothetical protein